MGTASIDAINQRLDEFILPENFQPYNKEISLAIRNDSGLRVNQIEIFKISYSFLGIKTHKYLNINE